MGYKLFCSSSFFNRSNSILSQGVKDAESRPDQTYPTETELLTGFLTNGAGTMRF